MSRYGDQRPLYRETLSSTCNQSHNGGNDYMADRGCISPVESCTTKLKAMLVRRNGAIMQYIANSSIMEQNHNIQQCIIAHSTVYSAYLIASSLTTLSLGHYLDMPCTRRSVKSVGNCICGCVF